MTRLRCALALGALFGAMTFGEAQAAPSGDGGDGSTFDRQAAASALSQVDLAKCRTTNAPRGEGHVVVRFVPEGGASSAVVDKGPMVGTAVAKCIANKFKQTKVPAFKGSPVQVGKAFHFE